MSSGDDDLLYLQANGLNVRSPESLNRALQDAIAMQKPTLPERPSEIMSEAEQQAFREIGIDVDDAGRGADPVTWGILEMAAIIESSLTAQETAKLLGVHRSLISQRLAEREIFSFRIDKRVVIPAFQFQGGALVPGITQVNRALPRTRHPLSVIKWFQTPQPELETEGSGPLTPLEWLDRGRDSSALCELAKRLHEHP